MVSIDACRLIPKLGWVLTYQDRERHGSRARAYRDVLAASPDKSTPVEVPQIDKDDIKVQVQNGMLNISGERKYENEDKKAHRIERYYGSFQRSFKLPDNVNEDKIHADHKNGVLYLSLPKTEEKAPALLDIKVH